MKIFQIILQIIFSLISKSKYQTKIISYNGSFSKGLYNGKGRLELKDGSVYEGQLKNNKMHGYGKIFLTDGSIYQGNFKNNLRNGTGISRNPDGSQQRVVYQNGKFKGVYTEDYIFYWKNTVEGAFEVKAENPTKAADIFHSLSKEEILYKSKLNTDIKKLKVTDMSLINKEGAI